MGGSSGSGKAPARVLTVDTKASLWCQYLITCSTNHLLPEKCLKLPTCRPRLFNIGFQNGYFWQYSYPALLQLRKCSLPKPPLPPNQTITQHSIHQVPLLLCLFFTIDNTRRMGCAWDPDRQPLISVYLEKNASDRARLIFCRLDHSLDVEL